MSNLVSFTTEGNSVVPTKNPVPDWLQIAGAYGTALGAIFTALGVLAALWAAFYWEPKKAREDRTERNKQAAEDRRRYEDQMAALLRAEDDRVAAQARKIVPTIFPADVLGENLWTVKVSNTSNGVVTNLAVSVTAVDADGNEIPNGCRQANREINVGESFGRIVREALSGSIGGALSSQLGNLGGMGGYGNTGGFQRVGPNPNQMGDMIAQRLSPEVSARFREALLGQMVSEWMTTLTPEQFAVMAFRTTAPDARLRVVLEFEDEAGYRWRRPDDGQPRKIDS
ncbi:hypothetical protein [Mycobacterium talmoniae]|uniref:Uncharacterized protein n=1 Tax=Mycobacterium talmoniae TaxID=1858794 RepID=A0A2S8BG48_9MYCO|nr:MULTISPECIES: hypothetical protein [Mycobacterium]PQM45651.1 hypothetical protein C1Y40_04182 [Mycobacterium talmoniae]